MNCAFTYPTVPLAVSTIIQSESPPNTSAELSQGSVATNLPFVGLEKSFTTSPALRCRQSTNTEPCVSATLPENSSNVKRILPTKIMVTRPNAKQYRPKSRRERSDHWL